MKTITPHPDRYTARWWHRCIQGTALALVLLISPNVPRADVSLLFLLALTSVFYFVAVNKSWTGIIEIQKERWLYAVFLGLSLYLHLNSLWAPDPFAALLKAGTFALVCLIAISMAGTFRHQSDGAIAHIGMVIIWSAIIGTGLASLEFATGHPIREAFLTAWPSIRPGDNSISVFTQINGEMIELAESEFRRHYENVKIAIEPASRNRGASLIMLLLWPLLLLAVNQTNKFTRRAGVLLIGLASVISVVLSPSQTAQSALVLSTLVFLAAFYLPRVTHHAIVGAWCVATVLAVPLAAAPFELELHRADWLFHNAQDRVVIWHYTARQIPKAPILGKGIRSTRVISKQLQIEDAGEPGDTTPPMRLGRHSHNHYLQIWYELGAAGALLFLLAGLALLQKIRSLAPGIRPYATAGFVAACSVAAFGWGLWQTWLLAGYSLSAIFLIFAAELAKRSAKNPKSS